MLFSSHVAAGFLVGSRLTGLGGFSTGLVSHLLMDALPHWGTSDRERFLEVARADGLFAGALALVLLSRRPSAAPAVLGAALPDLEKPFVHFTSRRLFPSRISRALSLIQSESESVMPRELALAVLLAALSLRSALRSGR